MLARLEAKNLLSDGSEVKNLGLIMGLYIRLAATMRDGSLLEDNGVEINKKPAFTWKPSRFDDYIHAYANKFGITLRGVDNLDEVTAELEDVSVIISDEAAWGWTDSFKSYSKDYARGSPMGGSKAKIGGDQFDITAWSSAERKAHSFNNKDPLTKQDRDALKAGMVLSIM